MAFRDLFVQPPEFVEYDARAAAEKERHRDARNAVIFNTLGIVLFVLTLVLAACGDWGPMLVTGFFAWAFVTTWR